MNECAPKNENERTFKEIFKMLQRKLGAFSSIDSRLPERIRHGKHNTSVALNLLADFTNNNLPLPSDWGDLAITEKTPFYFIKDKEGVLVSNQPESFFTSPTEFIQSLQKFYEIDNFIIAEEARASAAAEAARKAQAAADLADIRSGKWREAHMPKPDIDQASELARARPIRPSAFRPRG